MLHGREFTNIATDSKKDDCTELANVTMPTNPCETGNLKKVVTVKINTRVMIITNIDVTDGLTNGTMGTVTNVVIDQTTGKMSVILLAFDSEHVGQETRYTSVYAVPIHQIQAKFPVHKKHHFKQQGVGFHKHLLGMLQYTNVKDFTLPEIVIYMTCTKGKFKPGEAYIAFSGGKHFEKLHIINYT